MMPDTVPQHIRFTIGQGMAGIAVLALGCAWPLLFIPIIAGVILFVWISFEPSLIKLCVLIVLLGFVGGLILPIFVRPVRYHGSTHASRASSQRTAAGASAR